MLFLLYSFTAFLVVTTAQNNNSVVQLVLIHFIYFILPSVFPEHIQAFSRVSMSNSRLV